MVSFIINKQFIKESSNVDDMKENKTKFIVWCEGSNESGLDNKRHSQTFSENNIKLFGNCKTKTLSKEDSNDKEILYFPSDK